MSDTLVINEIFLSLQGESTWAGLPCIFIRLTACDLRCSYCDTAYAFAEGRRQCLEDIRAAVLELARPFTGTIAGHRLPLIEFTGGEPLLQSAAPLLMQQLCDDGFTVLVETSGAHDIAKTGPRVRRIMDLKCPASGESGRNRWDNLRHLQPTDEIKFVITTHEDYTWAREQITRHQLAALCPVLISWAQPLEPSQRDPSLNAVPPGQHPMSRRELAEQVLADALPVRFQAQLHKIIWPPEQRGV